MTTKGQNFQASSSSGGSKGGAKDNQPMMISAFRYSNVGGQEVRENWLAGSANVGEYRQKLFAAFKDSQSRYLARKQERRVLNQADNLIPLQENQDFMSVNPPCPNYALEKRRIIKQSRNILRKKLVRYMVLDNELLTYYIKDTDTKFKKNYRLEGCRVLIESTSERPKDSKWHDKPEQRYEFRVQILLATREFKPIFYYTNNLDEAKSLAAKFKAASTSNRQEFSAAINQASVQERILKFNLVWKRIETAYDSKILKIISFQLLGINLVEVANQAKTQRERLLKQWSNIVSSKEGQAAIRSTFRYGNPKVSAERMDMKSSLLVRKSLDRLANFVGARRVSRPQDVIRHLNRLLREEEGGFECKDINVIGLQQGGRQIKRGSIKVDEQSHLLIRDDNHLSSADKYFETNGPIRIDLDQVSCIATDKNLLEDVNNLPYTVRIYGRFQDEKHDSMSKQNVHPASLDYDVLRRVPVESYTIKINSIEIPLEFAKRYHQKGDLRVKLRQSQQVDRLDSNFSVRSRPYRIDVPAQLNYIPPNLIIDAESFIFTVDKLGDKSNVDEQFMLNLAFSISTIPINNVTKDILIEQELYSQETFAYKNYQNQIVKVYDKKGNEFKINFSMGKNSSSNIKAVEEREGSRLLVGRYVIVDQKMTALVKSVDRDGTLSIQYTKTKEEKVVNIKDVKLIEDSGVSTFNIRHLPHLVNNSQFTWIVEFTTTRQKLLNVIQSAIQKRQTALAYGFRKYAPEYTDRDIEGKLIVSVLEGRNFTTKDSQCNPFVILVAKKKQQSEIKSQQTDIDRNTNNPSWITRDDPTGQILEIGHFNKDTAFDEVLLLSVMTRNLETKADSLIGTASLNIESLLDIKEPAKEICLLIENTTTKIYGFLIIQTMFIPTKATRLKFVIKEDLSQFKSPEQYLHFKYLQKFSIHDPSLFTVPICAYKPNLLENIFSNQTYMMQSPDKKQMIEGVSQSKLLMSPDKQPDKSSAPQLVQVLNRLSSPEEKLALTLRNLDSLRPDVEEGVIIFKYLWKYRVSEPKMIAFQELQSRFWDKFLKEVQGSSDYLENVDQLDMSFTVNDQGQEEGVEKSRDTVSFTSWLQSLGGSEQKTKSQQKDLKFNLIFKGGWEKANNQKYADYYHLLMNGVPNNLRPLIWKDLLRAQIIEYEEEKSLRQLYGNIYKENLTVYENYKEVSLKSDCLAFRQVDEDIENFEFPKDYISSTDSIDKQIELAKQKRQMRHILRTVIMWSKTKTIKGKAVNFNYTKGVMYIVQRLITLMTEEEAFWVLNGIIRSLPRLYSTETSCLEGGRQSVLRYEMTVFKAILRENQPELCDKLRLLGIPVEHLIYDSISSLYSNFFSSAVVLRLWDLIIFNMSTREKVERRRALWYIMAPAYLILKEKASEIINASTVVQVVDIYNSGCALTFNPDWIVGELKVLVKDTFVRGAGNTEQNQADMNQLQLGFSKVSNYIKTKTLGSNDRAQQLEELRRKYEADLSIIFNSIEDENKEIGNILSKTKIAKKQGQNQYLDYVQWRTHVMARFKKVALKDSSSIYDALYDYDEPDLNREDLDLSKVNLYIHQLSHLPGSKLFKIKIMYGQVSKDGFFSSIEDHFSNDVYNNLKIQQFHIFDYAAGYNSLRIEILSNQNENVLCDLIVDLRDINANRFAKKWSLMKTHTLLNDSESFKNALSQIEISFFLQTHTAIQHNQMMSDKNPTMSKFVNSIKRKLPDKVDIFNKKNETDFVALMKGDFQRIIQEELEAMKCFLPKIQAVNTINDNYNFALDSDFGDLTLENFQFLIKQCFYPEWTGELQKVYQLLTKSHDQDELISPTKGASLQDNETLQNIMSGIKQKLNRGETSSPEKTKGPKLPFSLRNFLVSLVLMSHCTMNEKLDILYDLFDWNDGAADGLDLNSVYLLIKTIFERNLYYLPSHEIHNLIEITFDQSVSTVYAAYWTKEPLHTIQKRTLQMNYLLQNPELINTDEATSIDVTLEVQETLNSYQRMFGTKIIDFNYDSSAFKNIDILIKGGSQLIEMTSQTSAAQRYRLTLFYEVSGERNILQVNYDSNGQLIQNLELVEKDDLDEYLKRNINKLYLQGRSSSISKQEFMLKSANIPFLQDLIRVETFYRDRVQNTLVKKSRINQELVVILYLSQVLFIFRFSQKSNKDGDYRKLENNVYSVSMAALNEQDVVSDIRERIANSISNIIEKEQNLKKIDVENRKISKQVEGGRSFFIRDIKSNEWKVLQEFDRVERLVEDLQANQIVLLFEQSYQALQSKKQDQLQNSGFDSFSLYKHSDQTYDWRPCRIVRKTLINTNLSTKSQQSQKTSRFAYWVEFLHLKTVGKDIIFKRNREEVLLSARYSREQQRNFEEVSYQFIMELYGKNQPIERNTSPIQKKNKFMQQLDEDSNFD